MSSHADTIRQSIYYGAMGDEAREALDELLAENQRLRDALERIANHSKSAGHGGRVEYGTLWDAAEIAREALAGDAE